MILIGQDVLHRAGHKNAPLRSWLERWARTVQAVTTWHDIGDVRKQYPSADGVKLKSGLVVTVFNAKGNEYRLLTWIDYEIQSVEALEVLTHAEYDKQLWKGRF